MVDEKQYRMAILQASRRASEFDLLSTSVVWKSEIMLGYIFAIADVFDVNPEIVKEDVELTMEQHCV